MATASRVASTRKRGSGPAGGTAEQAVPKRPRQIVPTPALNADVGRAFAELAQSGKLTGARSDKISARVDPGLMKAAAERLGLRKEDVSELVNAALALAAAPDPFKTWLRGTTDTLPDDFELAV